MSAQRKDFDLNREYSVDVSNCSEEVKKLVQQAFFDVGISWELGHNVYKKLDAVQYTNTLGSGVVFNLLMYGSTTEDCNMTAKEFLDLVYEPEQVGHVHADLMAQYAEDAKTTSRPWKLWQIKDDDGNWRDCNAHPRWTCATEYRRKPKTKLVHGTEVPNISFIPEQEENYYFPNIDHPELYGWDFYFRGSHSNEMHVKGNRCYPYTEEGRQAAILHAKAMLGFN